MISANNVTLRVGKKALFEDVNIKFTEGNCYLVSTTIIETGLDIPNANTMIIQEIGRAHV